MKIHRERERKKKREKTAVKTGYEPNVSVITHG